VFLTHDPEGKKRMTSQVWKLGQWNQTLENCPANAYLIEERKPTFNDVSGELAEARRLKTEVAKFRLTTDERLSENATRQQLDEAKVVWETAQVLAREARLKEGEQIFDPAEIPYLFTGGKDKFLRDEKGHYIPNPKYKKKPERHERGRGSVRGQRRDRRDEDGSRSRSRPSSRSERRYYND
jgi:hypothetical protein